MLIKIYSTFSPEESKRIQVDSLEYKGITFYYKYEQYSTMFFAKVTYAFGEINEYLFMANGKNLEDTIQDFKNKWDITVYTSHDILRDAFIGIYRNCFTNPDLKSFGTIKCFEKVHAALGINQQEWDAYYSTIQILKQERDIAKVAQRQAEEKAKEERRLAEETKEKARIESVKQDIVNNKKVIIEDLIEICESLGIVIPIRTKGGFYKRVGLVDSQSYIDVKGKAAFKVSPVSYYWEAQEKLSKLVENNC